MVDICLILRIFFIFYSPITLNIIKLRDRLLKHLDPLWQWLKDLNKGLNLFAQLCKDIWQWLNQIDEDLIAKLEGGSFIETNVLFPSVPLRNKDSLKSQSSQKKNAQFLFIPNSLITRKPHRVPRSSSIRFARLRRIVG